MRITVLSQRGESVLVEYRDAGGALMRVYIPTHTLNERDETDGAEVDGDELDAGVPYGDAWETFPLGNVGAEIIAQELRERGIWTKSDLTRNLSQVRAALGAAYAKDLETLLNSARE